MKNTYLVLLLFFSFLLQNISAQEKFTVSGNIKDASNGEDLIGAAVFVKELSSGTTSNTYGFYALTLAKGKYQLVVSYVGYISQTFEVELSANQNLNVQLVEEQQQLAEVVITENRPQDNVQKIEMSVNRLDIKTIKSIPAFLGEVDVIKSIQLLPGISTVGEGATGYNARGGGIDQNLVLQDEAPVFNSSHLFGFFSVFNPDAVKDVKLIKGGIPAQYGGRLSSILDVRLKEGNNKKFEANGGIGAIFSRLTLEAPIVKDKASFIIAARRSYIDVLAKPFLTGNLAGSKFYFYDLTFKTNWKISQKDQVYLSAYLGRDVFNATNVFGSNWGNGTTTFRWNHVFGEKLFSNLTLYYSNYDYQLRFSQNESSFDWKSNVLTYSVKPEFNWYLNPKNIITFGGQVILYDFRPGKAVSLNRGITTEFGLPSKYAVESAIFIGNEQTLSSRFSLQYGLRYSYWNYLGTGTAYTYGARPKDSLGTLEPISTQTFGSRESIQTYGNLEPRFSLKYQLSANSSIKASYNRMAQYIHLLSNTAASTPLDVWTPSTNNIKPQIAEQVAIGYFRNFSNDAYEFSAETYYKDLQNQIDYIPGADLLLNANLEGELLYGKGRAYGLELYLRKNSGKFTGFVSYTLARTERLVNGVNSNKWFPARFDRTHNLSVTGNYEPNKRWSFSANFVIITGTPGTFPTERFEIQDYKAVPYIGDFSRNNVRIPVYHRLDLSATLQAKTGKLFGRKFDKYWVFSVYNAYNRRNAFSLYFNNNQIRGTYPEAVRLSIVGSFIPSVSYNFKF
ncbi:MAG: TonB-dependent receptor [Verrucomicrobia bacterium]|nr:TonB-dependent receptor [Cytophagales bacterium]